VPLAWFALAHASLASALVVLIAAPTLPGGFFYHPKMVALTHFLTLGWLSGSILGALYIVAPLALGCPMPGRRADWIAFASYAIGLAGMIAHFWIAEYSGMAWSAGMVIAAVGWVGWRVWRGLTGARVPWAVALHVRLAFANFVAAATLGIVIGLDRTSGLLTISPLLTTYAHVHLAALGWVGMMVVGVAYRLIPMMLPSAMPSGRALVWSAVLLEVGLLVMAAALVTGSPWLVAGAACIVAGFASAALQLGRAAVDRRPRPPRLPAIDWSMWHVRGAAVWLVVAIVVGLLLSIGATVDAWYAESLWLYGVAGLVGWLAQMVAAVQGRLTPLYAWYRALARRGGAPPEQSAHDLISAPLAAFVFAVWTAGVPVLAAGLAWAHAPAIRAAAALLLAGVLAGAWHEVVMLRRAGASGPPRAPAGARGKLSPWNASSPGSPTRPAARSSPPASHEC
jgi:hypothetical protein